MRGFAIIVTSLFLFWSPSLAQTSDAVDKARLARTVWSAFQCSTFAEMSGDKKEQARLFLVGLEAGRDFLEALKSGQISDDAMSKEVPVGVTLALQGPSPDFILGRIFENAVGALEISQWAKDDGLKKTKAQTEYGKHNCVFIK